MTSRAIASKLHSLLPDDFGWRKNWLWHYAIAVLSTLIALGTNLLFYPLLQGTPAALFYVAVMVSSWVGGSGPGLLTTTLSTLALHYFFLELRYSLGLNGLGAVVQLGVFAMAAFLISALNESRLAAKRRADANLKAWRESEAQFTRLAEANIIGIFAVSLNGLLTEANDAFLRMVGYTREDLLAGRIRWTEMTPPEYQEISERSQQELRATGICPLFEQECLCKDGSHVPVLLGLVMQDEQTINGFVLDRSEFRRNEAERKQAETALRESEERLRLATRAAGLGVFEWSVQADLAVWENLRMYEIFGRTLEEGAVTNAESINIIHPDDRVAFEQDLADSFEHGTLHTVCRIQRRNDGAWRWVELSGQVEFASDGTPLRLVGVVGDITDRRQVEAALRESEEKLRLATEGAKLGMWYWDIETNELVWNNQAKLLFGLPIDTPMSMQVFLEAVHPDDRPLIQTIVSDLETGPVHTESEYRAQWADGTIRWILARGNSDYDANGLCCMIKK